MTLNPQQVATLLRPIDKNRVATTNEGMSHLQVWDVRRWLIRIFGHTGFSIDVLELEQLYEQSKVENEQHRWRAAYRATVRLEVNGATYTEAAVGTNFGWLPDTKRDEAHDMAIKTAVSQATKRCAVNLGDQFGLSLYANTASAVVNRTLAGVGSDTEPPTDDPPVASEAHDPTTGEPQTLITTVVDPATVDTTPTPDPTEEPPESNANVVEDTARALVEAAGIEVKTERLPVVTRLSLEASKAKIVQSPTSYGVTIATLVDRAFAGEKS